MRSLMINKALAGQTFTAPTSQRVYPVDKHGVVSVFDDNANNGTKDASEAKAAGFAAYDPGERVTLKNAAFAKRNVPQADGHDIKMTVVEGGEFHALETDHHYRADEEGKISVFECDVAEAEAAGFARV